MAYTKTQVYKASGAFPALTGVTAGSLLVLEIHTFDDTTTISSITDTQSNTWTVHGISPATVATGERVTIASAFNATAGNTTATIVRNTGSVNMYCVFYEYAGFGASDPFQSIASAENTTANPSWNLSAVPTGALIVGGVSHRGGTITPGANYTKEVESTSNYYQYSQYDLDAGAGGTVAFDMTASAARWTGIAAVFNTASSSAIARISSGYHVRNINR